jgi:hypothetical protein
MHLAAIRERLAFDPAQDLAAFVVYSEPPWSGVEADALQAEQKVSDEQSVRRRWSADSASDTDDAFCQRAAGQVRLFVSRG